MNELQLSSQDKELADFKIGDARSFLRYFHEHYPYFLDFLISGYKLDPFTSKRIATAVFILLWMKRGDFDNWVNVKVFLYVTCKEKAMDFTRHLLAHPGDKYSIDPELLDQLPGDILEVFDSELEK